MSKLFNSILVDPLYDLLLFIYNLDIISDLGIAIIVFTALIRLVLFPLFYKGAKQQTLMQRLQPEINKVRKKYKDDREKQAQALMDVYKENNINPFSGIFMILIQIAVFFALFWIFRNGERIEAFSTPFFIGVPLIESSIAFALVVAFLRYFQGKLSLGQNKNMPKSGMMASFGKYMVYAAPVISFVVLTSFPAALAVYWGTNTLFSIGQQYIINKQINKKDKDKEENDDHEK